MHPLVIIGPVVAAIYWKTRKKPLKKRGHLWARHGSRATVGHGRPQRHVVVPAPEIEVSQAEPTGESTGEAEVIHPEVPAPDPAPVEVPVVEVPVVEKPLVEVAEA